MRNNNNNNNNHNIYNARGNQFDAIANYSFITNTLPTLFEYEEAEIIVKYLLEGTPEIQYAILSALEEYLNVYKSHGVRLFLNTEILKFGTMKKSREVNNIWGRIVMRYFNIF